jgi:hypothetical protein
VRPAAEIFNDLPADAPVGDKDLYIDAVIARAKALLGEDGFRVAFDLALNDILADIRQDLEEFGVRYDEWFSERSLSTNGAIDRALERLRANGVVYEKDGASGSAPPISATRRTAWWCARTGSRPISLPTSPTTCRSASAASTG